MARARPSTVLSITAVLLMALVYLTLPSKQLRVTDGSIAGSSGHRKAMLRQHSLSKHGGVAEDGGSQLKNYNMSGSRNTLSIPRSSKHVYQIRRQVKARQVSEMTSNDKSPERHPMTVYVSGLIKKYMEEQMKDSLTVIGSFKPEQYLASQRMKEGEGDPYRNFGFNQVASDATPFNRPLQDSRHHRCSLQYKNLNISSLPKTSIIICFHNEARSALLRTVVSVLSRSPTELIEEILLVDDFSTDPNDGLLLTGLPKVRLLRLHQREGLIRARIAGVKAARGEVLTFLDSHCEATPGWLQPLLVRINEDYTHVVSPVLDIIEKTNMAYSVASVNTKGGFGTDLYFKWDVLSKEVLNRRKINPTEPIRSPAIAGGLFAINKAYFEHIGIYDPGMDIWGAENVDMSVRVWLCGGTLEIMPCSHVGHIFRTQMPYGFGPGKSFQTTVTKNLRRFAEVWLDDYKNVFYEANPLAKMIPTGDISERLNLKKKLQCKPFQWFVDNIYPEFDSDPGEFVKLKQGSLCLQRQSSHDWPFTMSKCIESTEDDHSQVWEFNHKGILSHQDMCISVGAYDEITVNDCKSSKMKIKQFKKGESVGRRFTIQLQHTGLCVSAVYYKLNNLKLFLRTCNTQDPSQLWQFIS